MNSPYRGVQFLNPEQPDDKSSMMDKLDDLNSPRKNQRKESNIKAQNFETDSFEFQNNIDVSMKIELENFRYNLERFKNSMTEEQIENHTECSFFDLSMVYNENLGRLVGLSGKLNINFHE